VHNNLFYSINTTISLHKNYLPLKILSLKNINLYITRNLPATSKQYI